MSRPSEMSANCDIMSSRSMVSRRRDRATSSAHKRAEGGSGRQRGIIKAKEEKERKQEVHNMKAVDQPTYERWRAPWGVAPMGPPRFRWQFLPAAAPWSRAPPPQPVASEKTRRGKKGRRWGRGVCVCGRHGSEMTTHAAKHVRKSKSARTRTRASQATHRCHRRGRGGCRGGS